MIVKVIKWHSPTVWYAGCKNEEFEVEETSDGHYSLKEDLEETPDCVRFIRKGNCEIVSE